MDYAEQSLRLHEQWRGKIEITARAAVDSKQTLSLAYTPGVAKPWKFRKTRPKAMNLPADGTCALL